MAALLEADEISILFGGLKRLLLTHSKLIILPAYGVKGV